LPGRFSAAGRAHPHDADLPTDVEIKHGGLPGGSTLLG
jgi:hypothetical protein